MIQFGLPQRTATGDANQGVVNPPSVKRTPREFAAEQKQVTSLDTGVEKFGASLGAALEERLDTETTNINEQRMADAVIRQGQDSAINRIDVNKKRTGWERGVFGEDIEYRAAQQRGVTNSVNAEYLKQATSLEQYSGETPDDYSVRLKGGLDSILKPYADDPETKRMATSAWLVSSGKLAAKQYEAHYAYNQIQQRDKYSQEVELTFDTWTVDNSLASTPEEAKGMKVAPKMFFDKETKPEAMDDISWKGVVNEQLMNSLRNGNIRAYKAAEDHGWLDDLNVNEEVAMDRALSAYDTGYSQQVATMYEQANLSALEAKTIEEAEGIYTDLQAKLKTIGTRSSGSTVANDALSNGEPEKATESLTDILGMSESSNNYKAKNSIGYVGKYQFGGMALEDTGYKIKGKWTGKDGVNSEEDWLNNPEAQEKAMSDLVRRNTSALNKWGTFDHVGTVFNGVNVTRDGILAASHLVGAKGVDRMFESGKVPKDDFGTTALKYMKKFDNGPVEEGEPVEDALPGFSGSDKAKLQLARTKATVQQKINATKRAQDKAAKAAQKVAKKAYDAALKAQAEQKRTEDMKIALRNPDPRERAAGLNDIDPKKSELEDVLDIVITEDITRLAGSETPLTLGEATTQLLGNPTIAKSIAQKVKGQEVTSPLVKRTIETFINGFQGLTDENGQMTEQGRIAMSSVAQFEQNEDSFKSTIGNDNYDRYEIIRRGMSIGQTSDMVMKTLDAYSANKGKRDIYGSNWGLKEHESKRDRVQSLVKRFTKQTPYGSSLAHYMEEYDRALIVHQEDRKAAENYLRVSALNAAINYQGRVITNGKHLNEVTDYNFQQLMDGAQKSSGVSASLMTPYLAALGVKLEDKGGKPLTSIDQVQGLSLYAVDGIEGFYLDSLDAQAPVHVTKDVMERWGDTLNQRGNFQKLRDKQANKTADRWLKEQEENRENLPFIFP